MSEIECMKQCTKCEEYKPRTEFRARARKDCREGYVVAECRKCERNGNKERMRTYVKTDRYKTKYVAQYGLSWEVYQQMLTDQRYACAACFAELDQGPKTHIDHCHRTGKVRGILCRDCNIALGLLGDDESRVEALLTYIQGADDERD